MPASVFVTAIVTGLYVLGLVLLFLMGRLTTTAGMLVTNSLGFVFIVPLAYAIGYAFGFRASSKRLGARLRRANSVMSDGW